MVSDKRRQFGGLAVTSKVFVRSRHGKATKVVREHYLRNDIPCYSTLCNKCPLELKPSANGELPHFVLSRDPPRLSNGMPHYVVVDTNVILHAIDLLENKECFYDVIVPQTVLEEVRNRSYPVYQRLRTIILSEEKRFVVYHNEFNENTYVPRQKDETINDRNDRAIRKFCDWYKKHIVECGSNLQVDVILVCNDKLNKEKAIQEGVNALSLTDYIEALPNGQALSDLIPSGADLDYGEEQTIQETSFPEYYPVSRILGGISNGSLYQGVLNISSYNFLEGTVNVGAFKKPLLVIGTKNLNRAFNGDSVVVEMLPKDKWRAPTSTIVEEGSLNSNDADVEEVEDEVADNIISDRERRLLAEEANKVTSNKEEHKYVQPTARVVGIIRRSWRYYVGHLSPGVAGGKEINHLSKSCLVTLMDKTLPRIRIRTRKFNELLNKRLVLVVDSWPSTSKYPLGHFVRSLGDIESPEAETEALLLEHDVEYRPFSKKVVDCLPKEGTDWKVPDSLDGDEKLKKRKDLRDKCVCSIDPPNCVDIDDALHAKKLPNGNFEVGVHIADVTHFVQANTPLDNEAASRSTSVYLVDKRIDMLPILLSSNLCSLRPEVDRFAFSVIWEVDENANIVNVDFMKSVIRSRKAYSYEQAQLDIDDKLKHDELTESIRILNSLAKKLKEKRLVAGALNLASPEVKVYMDNETSDPGEVEIKKTLETNSLVEEFMLFANISVARKIYDCFPQTAMLRRHAAPPATNFEVLNDMLRVRKNGMSISLDSSRALADSLDRCIEKDDPYFNTLLRIMTTRCMMAAEYFTSGMYGYPDFRHYGLAVDIYTHFTSPIRRYCDVIAHRQLAGAIGYENLDLVHRDKNKMELIVRNMNKRHRNGQFAGRASIEYYVGQVMRENQTSQEGYVIKCFNNGIVVLVPKFGVEGLIKLEMLGDIKSAEYNEEKYELAFTDFGGKRKCIGVFDKVVVEVKSVKDESTGKRKAQLLLL